MLRLITLLLSFCLLSTACVGSRKAPIDHLVVYKAKREMHLYSGNRLIKTVPIALGRNPVLPKQHKGDGRTPEGRYYVTWRNPNSQYTLSLLLSYPNQRDKKRATMAGLSPGGDVMIHGLPKEPKLPDSAYLASDWTEGCIAVSNDVIQELFTQVALNSPIDIYP